MSSENISFVFLRGLVRESRHWRPFLEVFNDYYPGAKVNLVDAPGTGKFVDQRSPLKISEYVDAMRRQLGDYLEDRAIDEKRVLVCISMGGMIGAEWLQLFPSDFDAVVLINSSFSSLSGPFERLKPDALREFGKAVLRRDIHEREKQILELVSGVPQSVDKLLPLWEKIQRDAPVTVPNFFRQMAAAIGARPPLEPPSIPSLIFFSKADRIVHYQASMKIAELWGSSWRCHEWGGHNLPDDDPKWMAENIRTWLRSQFPSTIEEKDFNYDETPTNDSASVSSPAQKRSPSPPHYSN